MNAVIQYNTGANQFSVKLSFLFNMDMRFMQKVIKSIDNKEQVTKLLNGCVDKSKALSTKDDHGDTLLHFASRIQNIPVMKLLIDLGADPEAVNEHGRRPIHEAIDSFECVSFLVNTHHVDINAMKRGDWTPIMITGICYFIAE
jgi:hypothetical protein